jgi:hypothetical protein
MIEPLNTKKFIAELQTQVGNYPDGQRVAGVIEDILAFKNPTEISWYFSEVHDTRDHVEEYLETLTFHTVYDSSRIPGIGDYNIVSIAQDEEHFVVAISLNGSRLASALTEYIRFKRYTVGETFGVTEEAIYYDENGM